MEKKYILRKIESKGFNKSIWNKAGKAMYSYGMIKEGDRIAIGISGGKDSLVLFNTLLRLKNIVDFNFEIFPININYEKEENPRLKEIKEYIESLGEKLYVEKTNIKHIVFEEKKAKNPCFLCSRLKRGVLYRLMQEQNINKLALGHHLDDVIETFLMNLFFQGNTNVMKLMYQSEEYGFEIIRPLCFVEEKAIIKYSKKVKLPIMKSLCDFNEDKNSKRKQMKDLITNLSKENKDIRNVVLNALKEKF